MIMNREVAVKGANAFISMALRNPIRWYFHPSF